MSETHKGIIGIRTALQTHQEAAVAWMITRKGGILADDMGLGKTLTSITVCVHVLNAQPNAQILVLLPKSLMGNWQAEIIQHTTLEKRDILQVGRIEPSAEKLSHARFVLVTYDKWRVLEYQNSYLIHKKWTCVVLDEAHIIRTKKTRVTRAVMRIQAELRWCVTGTPINNYRRDVITLCRFIGQRPYNQADWWAKNATNSVEIDQWRTQFILRREKETLNLLPIIHEKHTVQFSPDERALYDRLFGNMMHQYADLHVLGGLQHHTAQLSSLLVLLLRVRQTCSHPRLMLPRCDMRSSKTNAICAYVRERLQQNGKIIIFSQWTKYLDLLAEEIDTMDVGYLRFDGRIQQVEKRHELVREFITDPNKKIFMSTMQAGGLGLNLTIADTVIMCDYLYNPFAEEQAFNRVHRMGQSKQVRVVRFEVEDTIEQRLQRLQDTKRNESRYLIQNMEMDDSTISYLDIARLLDDGKPAFSATLTSSTLIGMLGFANTGVRFELQPSSLKPKATAKIEINVKKDHKRKKRILDLVAPPVAKRPRGRPRKVHAPLIST